MFDDDKFGLIFPVRHGAQIGIANERTMLSAIGGADSFRTRMQLNSDGSVTIMRTKNGMPQFETVARSLSIDVPCYLEMDSGIVDLHTSSNTFGTIFQTSYVSSHAATSVDGKGFGCGKVSSSDGIGDVVAEGAESVAFTSNENAPMNFVSRRALALRIPSSIFTGRTRLYAQSLLGSARSDLILSDVSNGIGRPILGVTTVIRDAAAESVSVVYSGCGVFKEPSTGKHYLLYPAAGTLLVYPLSATACAEKFRKFIIDEAISEANRERIEAYILAYSVPSILPSQILTYDDTTDESLGYSWHFNYDGDKADIVDVEEIDMGAVYGFRTTHYRLTISYSSGVFSVSRSVVSGPTEWSVPKNQNVIAFPDWTISALVKAGNIPSGISDQSQSGVIYAFYDRNDLHTVSYDGTQATHDKKRTSSPPYYGGLKYESYFLGYLKTGESGETKAIAGWSGNTNVFTCGSISVGDENFKRNVVEQTHDFLSRIIVATTDEVSWRSSRGWVIQYGDPSYTLSYDNTGTPSITGITWGTTSVSGGISLITSSMQETWQYKIKSYAETQTSFTLTIIPFNDSQAVYLGGKTSIVRNGKRTVSYKQSISRGGDTTSTPLYTTAYRAQQIVNGTTYDKSYIIAVQSNSVSYANEPIVDYTYSSVTPLDTQLVCSNGTVLCEAPDQSLFYDGEVYYVTQLYNTLESVNGVALSPETSVYVGGSTWPTYPSLVGWA